MKRLSMALAITVLFTAVGWGFYRAINSDLFIIQEIEIKTGGSNKPELKTPLNQKELKQKLGVQVGVDHLLSLDLQQVEKRMLQHPWIQKVNLTKELPDRLSVQVAFREPQGILHRRDRPMMYVDQLGRSFASVDWSYKGDLPLIQMNEALSSQRRKKLLEFIQKWRSFSLDYLVEIASLKWKPDQGLRIVLLYSKKGEKAPSRPVMVMNEKPLKQLKKMKKKLRNVFRYLSQNSIDATRIWLGTGKKIVVKRKSRS